MSKVLVISESGMKSESEVWLIQILQALDPATHNPVVVLPAQGSLSADLEELNISNFILPGRLLNCGNPIIMWLAIWKLHKLIPREEYSCVVCHGAQALIVALCYSMWIDRPLTVLWTVGEMKWRVRWLLNYFSEKINIIAVSATVQNFLRTLRLEAPVTLLRPSADPKYYVEVDKIIVEEYRRKLALPLDQYVVGIIGALNRTVDWETALNALVITNDPRAVLAIARYENDEVDLTVRNKVERQIRDLHIQRQVVWVDPQQDMLYFLNCIDCLLEVNISRTVGISLLQAIAQKKPVVANNTDNVLELFRDGYTASLFPQGDAERAAILLRNIRDNILLKEKYATNGQVILKKEYAPEQFSDNVRKYFQRG